MKISRRQLRRLIESVVNEEGDMSNPGSHDSKGFSFPEEESYNRLGKQSSPKNVRQNTNAAIANSLRVEAEQKAFLNKIKSRLGTSSTVSSDIELFKLSLGVIENFTEFMNDFKAVTTLVRDGTNNNQEFQREMADWHSLLKELEVDDDGFKERLISSINNNQISDFSPKEFDTMSSMIDKLGEFDKDLAQYSLSNRNQYDTLIDEYIGLGEYAAKYGETASSYEYDHGDSLH